MTSQRIGKTYKMSGAARKPYNGGKKPAPPTDPAVMASLRRQLLALGCKRLKGGKDALKKRLAAIQLVRAELSDGPSA